MLRLLLIVWLVFPARVLLAHEGRAIPEDVWTHWNTDPLLLVALLLPAYVYVRGVATYRVAGWRKVAFGAGMLALFAALISPLDTLGATLFSGHMLQHMLFVLLAAPLLVMARPLPALLRGLPPRFRKSYGRVAHAPLLTRLWQHFARPDVATVLHVGVLWVWHIPDLYSAALENGFIHMLQHLSFFLTGVLFWWMIWRSENYGARILAIFGVMMLTGLLGALMTFATTPWYSTHEAYVSAWGLTPLEDQQLAGLFMWIPPGVVYVVAAGLVLGAWLNAIEQQVVERELRVLREMSDA